VQISFRALNLEVESSLIVNLLVRNNQKNIGRRQINMSDVPVQLIVASFQDEKSTDLDLAKSIPMREKKEIINVSNRI
jgi:hypothetical protein